MHDSHSLWHSDTVCDTVTQSLTQWNSLWHSDTVCDTVTQSVTQWHSLWNSDKPYMHIHTSSPSCILKPPGREVGVLEGGPPTDAVDLLQSAVGGPQRRASPADSSVFLQTHRPSLSVTSSGRCSAPWGGFQRPGRSGEQSINQSFARTHHICTIEYPHSINSFACCIVEEEVSL